MLIEIIRRAAYDWVLYRNDDRAGLCGLAMDAEVWLFQEGPGHAVWEERRELGELSMSFLGICESLELDPDTIREGIRSLTPQRIKTLGRIPTSRNLKGSQDNLFGEDVSMVSDFPAVLKSVAMDDSNDIPDDVGGMFYGRDYTESW